MRRRRTGSGEEECYLGGETTFKKYCIHSYGCVTRREDLDGNGAWSNLVHTKLEPDCKEEDWKQGSGCRRGNFYSSARPNAVPDKLHFIKTGLIENTNYSFSVRAVQQGGKQSELSNPRLRLRTPSSTVPGGMFAPTVTRSEGGLIRVDWVEPINRGGVPITEYVLKMGVDADNRKGLFAEIYKGPSMHFVQGALLASTKYEFKV